MEDTNSDSKLDIILKVKLEQLSLAQGRAQHQESRNWNLFSIFLSLFSIMFGLVFTSIPKYVISNLTAARLFFSLFGFILSVFHILALRKGQKTEARLVVIAGRLEEEIINLLKHKTTGLKDISLEGVVWKKVYPKLNRFSIRDSVRKTVALKKPFVFVVLLFKQISSLLIYKFEKTSIGKLMLPIAWFFLILWLFLICAVLVNLI